MVFVIPIRGLKADICVLCFVQLAARIAVSNLHKNTKKSFSET